MTKTPARRARPRLWQNLALAGTAATLAATGAASAGTGFVRPGAAQLWPAQSQSSEGGEGGESGAPQTLSETVGILTDLGLLEGYLRVGLALYLDGHADMAATHMKGPDDQIYAGLKTRLGKLGIDGFDAELAALGAAVRDGKEDVQAQDAFEAVLARITATRRQMAAEPRQIFDAAVAMLQTAAKDYDAGVKDGAVTDLHEYQDAWGFIQTVRALAEAQAGSSDGDVRDAAGEIVASVDTTGEAFDGLAPKGKLPGDASSVLYAAAARAEFAAGWVK